MRLFRRRSDRDFAEEIEAHLALEADRLRAEGVSESEARAHAARAFGNVASAQERFYESRRAPALDGLARDVRYALRGLTRRPAFTVAAVLTLALGIGANTAVFSAVDEILFRPPDLPAADRLVQVYTFQRKTSTYVSSSYPDYLDFKTAASFRNLAAYVRMPLAVAFGDSPAERISVDAVSGSYFETLGVRPVAGRELRVEDDRLGASPAAWIGEGLWGRRFQRDPGVAGRSISIEGRRFTIAGVVPDRFGDVNLNWATPPQIWIPLRAVSMVAPRLDSVRAFESRAVPWLVLTGRLRPGVSAAAAQSELQAIAGRFAIVNPATNRDVTAVVLPLSRSKFWPSYRASVATSLSAFAIASGLLLLLACANVSNLLLERGAGRRREFAVRLAIGADRRSILQHVLAESAVLALGGCAAALLIAQAAVRLLERFPNALGLPLSLDLRVEPRALAFCMAISVAAMVLAGIAPALAATRLAFLPVLKQSATAPRVQRLQGVLVATQAALSVILLIGGGLYSRTLWRAYSADLGFDADHVLTGAFAAPLGESARFQAAQREFMTQLAEMPGVVSASVSSHALLAGGHMKSQVEAEANRSQSTDREYIGAAYFATAGIPLMAGREFTPRDDGRATRVAIVNETLASTLWPGENALGRVLTIFETGTKRTAATVVGVARTVKYSSVWEQPQPRLYLPAAQYSTPASYFLVRSRARPEDLTRAASQMWSALAPETPLYDLQTGAERVDSFLTPQRVAAGILGGFGVIALILTAVGLYSVVAFAVAQQSRDIGIRIAIGASPGAIMREMLRRSLRWVLVGLAAGALGSVATARVLAANIHDVSPYDAATYVGVAFVLVGIGAAASIGPVRRAARIDPALALRSE